MRKISLLTILGLLLCSAVILAEEPRSEDQLQANLEQAVSDEVVSTVDQSSSAEVEKWDTQPEWAAFPRPVPAPNYCPDCQACTSNAACGLDPHNGAPLGVCSPPPNSYCPGTSTTSQCICY